MVSVFSSTLEFNAKSAQDANAMLRALSLESTKMERSSCKISVHGEKVLIEICASDIVALKASFNSLCRILEAIHGIKREALKEKEE